MNEIDRNNEIERLLEETAESLEPNVVFTGELEQRLRKAHTPRRSFALPNFASLSSAAMGLILAGVLIAFMVWLFQTLQPHKNFGNDGNFDCPVTLPNGSQPPDSAVTDPYSYGNGGLWTSLWPQGRIVMEDHNVEADGSYSMKWGFIRGVTGPLTVEGRRLDGEAEPLRAWIPDGYGDTGLQIIALIFPTTGCWEVTGRVGEASLTFVTEVIYKNDATTEAEPTQGVIIDPDAAPSDTSQGGYEFRGGKLFLEQPLPASPGQANLYTFIEDQPATKEEALALAEKFNLDGGIYQTTFPQFPERSGYVVSDGKRMLTVYTANYFTYAPDLLKTNRGIYGAPNDNAEAVIREFLAENGFDIPFSVAYSGSNGSYLIHQRAPDGLAMEFDLSAMQFSRVIIGMDGEVVYMEANLMNYDPTPLGSFEIISAQQALDAVVSGATQVGTMESGFSSGGEPPQMWYREYPDNQRVTLSANLTKYESAEAGQSPLLLLDGIQAIGNTSGLETLNDYAFVQAAGQFVVVDGIRKFEVESVDPDAAQNNLTGFLKDEGGQIILVSDIAGDEYIVMDPPAGLPLNTEPGVSYLAITGVVTDDNLDWSSIQFFADASSMGGGGGGGGMGFFKINVNGTPVVFPTPIPTEEAFPPAELAASLQYIVKEGDTLESIAAEFNVPVEDIMRANYMTDPNIGAGWIIVIPGVPAPTRLDGTRGIVQVNVYVKPDGRERTQYTFITEEGSLYYQLEGDNLEGFKESVNRPVAIWGGIQYGETGTPVLTVEKFEVLYPGIQFEVLRGRQELIGRNGVQLVLIHSQGETYVQLSPSGAYPDTNYYSEGEINLEILRVPGETYAGYPAVRVFNSAPAFDPVTGQPLEVFRTAERIEPMPDPFGNNDTYIQPDLIIDSVELVYFTRDPKMQFDVPASPGEVQYIEPVWRFHGRYTSGGEAVIFVQALTKEHLLPEIQGVAPPG